MANTQKNAVPMTQGNPMKQILLFSLPLLAGNFLQQMYNMVDSMIVGQFVGTTALAAVGSAFTVVAFLSSFFIGLGMGTVILVSQYYGAGDTKKLRATVDTIYTVLVVGAIPLSVIGMLCVDPIAALLQVPSDVLPEFRIYLLIILGGLIGMFGYNANSGILQGLGDSRSPLIFLIISSVINIVLDLIFVLVFHWGAAGTAIATVIAQVFSWLFGVVWINRRYPELRIQPFSFRFDREIFGKILKMGIPIGIQQALFSFGSMTMTGLVNSQGSTFAAGYNAAGKVDTFAYLPLQSFSSAVTTFTGQNIGAGKQDRVRSGVRAGMLLSTVSSVVLAVVLLIFGEPLLDLFTPDAAVVADGMAYMVRVLPFYWLLGIICTLGGVLRGSGAVTLPIITNILVLWLLRIPSAYLLADHFGSYAMHFNCAIGWAAELVVDIPYYLSGHWKKKAVLDHKEAEA